MGQVLTDMGFIRYPLLFSCAMIVALSLLSAARLFRPAVATDLRTKAWIDAVLFWGGFASIAGVLGTFIGIIIAAQSIEQAGEVSATLVWGGIKVATTSAAFGTLILSVAALIWFGLQLRWRLLHAEALEG